MDKILINNMSFYGYHGVFPEETKLGQRFKVDVVLETDLSRAGKTDDLSYTINYAEVYEMVSQVVEGPPMKLVERLAEIISQKLLSHFPTVLTCHVKVVKPDPPIAGHYDSVAIEITRNQRGTYES